MFVGSNPPKRADVRKQPQRYIKSVEVQKRQGAPLREEWFNCNVELNPGLVAIVGNKGSGKSALADILALGGNSQHDERSYSFLNQTRFRNPREDKSIHFKAELTWQSDQVRRYGLSDSPDREDVERVRYIPQSHLEQVCNEITSEGGGTFDQELRAVIFSHIPVAERLGKQSLDALLAYLGEETFDRINVLQGELSKTNREIAALEADASPERKREIEKRRTAKLRELSVLKNNEPKAQPKPDTDPATTKAMQEIQVSIDAARTLVGTLEAAVDAAAQERKSLLSQIATADKILQRVRNFEDAYSQLEQETREDLEALGLDWEDLVKLQVDTEAVKTLHAELANKEAATRARLDTENEESETSRLTLAKQDITRLQNLLDAPTRRHQEYVTAHKEWVDAVASLESDIEDPDSLASLNAELQRIAELPAQIAGHESERGAICRRIHEQIVGLQEHYRKLYQPVQDFILKHQTLAESIQLSFDVRISETNLADELAEWIDKGRKGSFQGAEDGVARIKDIVGRHTFDGTEGLEAFLDEFMQALKNDVRHEKPRPMSTATQLKGNRTAAALYDFLYGLSFLKPRYALKMEGKELFELSPGERGLLLLLFYLLVEKNNRPLILDQPEENLDNETVHEVLVPSIKLAKQRRQIIVVTHNPNLAVVADADQVIAASIDKKHLCRVTYESGALENPKVNRRVVRYLEGTLPAFMKRDKRYIR